MSLRDTNLAVSGSPRPRSRSSAALPTHPVTRRRRAPPALTSAHPHTHPQATLPTPAEVLFTEGLWVPLVNVGGVYILPGIPRLFQSMVAAHQVRRRRGGVCVCLNSREGRVVYLMGQTQAG